MDPEAFVEKGDLVRRVRELAAVGPATSKPAAGSGGGGAGAPAGAYPPPLGFAFDPGSGYYVHSEVRPRFHALVRLCAL